MKNGKCTSLSDHHFVLCDMETGMGSVCTICGISSYEAVMAEECNMKNTPQDVDQSRNQQLDQLKANAKVHKKHVDRLSAKISKLTQQRNDTAMQLSLKEQEAAFYKVEFERHCKPKMVKSSYDVDSTINETKPNKSDRTKWSTLLLGAGFVYLSGFLLTLGFFSAVGWVGFIGGLVR